MKIIKSISLLVCSLLLLGLNASWNTSQADQSLRLVVGGYIGLAFFIIFLLLDFRERKTIDLIHLYLCGCILRVGVGGVYSGYIIGSEHWKSISTRGHLPVEMMSQGLLLMQLGSMACLFGMMIAEKRRRYKSQALETKPKYPPLIMLVIMVVVSWFFVVLKKSGFPSLGVLGYAMTLIPDAVVFIFAFLSITKAKNRKMMILIVCMMIGMQFLLVSGNQMREVYAFILLPVFVAFGVSFNMRMSKSQPVIPNQSKRKKSSRARNIAICLFGSVILSFLVFVMFPAATQVKRGEVKTLKEGIHNVVNSDVKNDDFPDQGIYALPFRMSVLVVAPAIIIEAVENEGYTKYSPLLNTVAALVPRALWKSKPIISKGAWFANYLNPNQEDSTSFALTMPGELYWSYGWYGSMFLMLVIGVTLRKLWTYLFTRIFSNPIAVVAFIVLCRECIRWFESEASRPVSLLLLLFILTFMSELFPKSVKRKAVNFEGRNH